MEYWTPSQGYVMSVYPPFDPYYQLGTASGLGSSSNIRIPLPGGGQATVNASGVTSYRHPNWQGSQPIASSTSRTILVDNAFTAFGEKYAGLNGGFNGFFANMLAIGPMGLMPDGYSANFRVYNDTQSRWITTDPAGLSAVDPLDPQSWNRYAYVANDPLHNMDPSGLYKVLSGRCLYELTEFYVQGEYQGAEYKLIEGYGSGDSGSGAPNGGGGGGGGGTVAPAPAPNNQILPCFAKGAATGAVGALVVGGAAAGASALGIVSAPVVTAVLGVAAVAGGAYAIYNGIQQARAGNWGGVAFGVGSFAGGAVVGGAGGRALAETINGVASPAWSIGSDWAQGYRSNFPGGSVGSWWNSGTNPGSAGGSAASAGAGAATVAKKGC